MKRLTLSIASLQLLLVGLAWGQAPQALTEQERKFLTDSLQSLEKTLAEQTRGVMAQSVFTELSAETAGADASDERLADGTAVTWTVVPARFDVETGGSRSRNEQPMLALREGADWYFIRIEGAAQSQMVSLAYPFLADAHFPAATVTPLD